MRVIILIAVVVGLSCTFGLVDGLTFPSTLLLALSFVQAFMLYLILTGLDKYASPDH